jgi:hypothetical protein
LDAEGCISACSTFEAAGELSLVHDGKNAFLKLLLKRAKLRNNTSEENEADNDLN